ncbi:MAG: hypothetical protein WEB56_06475 [Roseovarius sp.]
MNENTARSRPAGLSRRMRRIWPEGKITEMVPISPDTQDIAA